jgi:formate C-acetyltransferase
MKKDSKKSVFTNPFVLQNIMYVLFRAMSLKFAFNKKFRELIKNEYDTFNKTIAIQTRDKSVKLYMVFNNGKLKVKHGIPEKADLTIIYRSPEIIKEFATLSPEEMLNYLLTNKLTFKGNLSYLSRFAYLLNNFIPPKDEKIKTSAQPQKTTANKIAPQDKPSLISRRGLLIAKPSDNVKYLDEPYLQAYTISDFPGLEMQRNLHFTSKPSICPERPELITTYFMETGFEFDKNGKRRPPLLRQAEALNYILTNKKPIIRANSLLAGTTTSKEIGVMIYPEGHGITLWPELKTISKRKLQPYDIDNYTVELLDKKVFPFWSDRNVREYARITNNFPRYQELDEKFVLYFMWKTVALSHTVPDFPRMLKYGLIPVIEDARKRKSETNSEKQNIFYSAIEIALQGVLNYADHLRQEALRLATDAENAGSGNDVIAHYKRLADILERVPAYGARNLYEAVQSLWILWIALHNESTNAGLSLGHLDLWLQPYFESDMKSLNTREEKEAYIKHAIELIGNFFFKCQDHLPLVADIGNKLFGGSSSDQAITLGGIDEQGNSAVNDMTYIFLKVTEMLTIRDPNMNARYYPGINSDTYLKRLIEVNMVTTATPSIHNDKAMIQSLKSIGFKEEDARQWCATGCVEPTIPGKHFGHTNSMMFNMVAALEMALNNGVHPLAGEQIGIKTGSIEEEAFPTFEDFFQAFERQLRFLAYQTIECNNSLGFAHQVIRPTPILSSMFEGPMEVAKDLTEGGARYNTSGVACIGLTDIVDSLMTIKKLVYDEKKVDFKTLHKAINDNFEGYEKLHAMIQNKVPKFGSDDPEVNNLAQRVVDTVFDIFYNRTNYRGGHYLVGFWSMSNHVAFGTLSGALPSGRLRYKPFTPGLTPENVKGVDLLSSIRTIAALKPEKMPNNIAFNVKVAPDSRDTHEETVNQITAYAKSYFELGGMQMQFNIITTETLKDAMEHPENYRNLLVRVSGYNAYFVELDRDLQLEIINRQQMRV